MAEWFQAPGFNAANLGFFYARLFAVVSRRNLRVRTLGYANGWPIFFVHGQKQRQSLLVAAGFHGEEQAGPWALLWYLETADDIDVSFLPMVNPSGFMRTRRCNDEGDSPNTGFIHVQPGEHLSAEGEVLKANVGRLRESGAEGFLTLHEQAHAPCFYLYALEKESSALTLAIRDAGARFFPLAGDGPVPPPGSGMVRSGIVSNEHDGTFEDLLFHEGVSRCFTTETPGMTDLPGRLQAGVAVIRTFVGRD